jgi:hypothetical protein
VFEAVPDGLVVQPLIITTVEESRAVSAKETLLKSMG